MSLFGRHIVRYYAGILNQQEVFVVSSYSFYAQTPILFCACSSRLYMHLRYPLKPLRSHDKLSLLPSVNTLEMPLLGVANELLLCISDNLESERDINAFA